MGGFSDQTYRCAGSSERMSLLALGFGHANSKVLKFGFWTNITSVSISIAIVSGSNVLVISFRTSHRHIADNLRNLVSICNVRRFYKMLQNWIRTFRSGSFWPRWCNWAIYFVVTALWKQMFGSNCHVLSHQALPSMFWLGRFNNSFFTFEKTYPHHIFVTNRLSLSTLTSKLAINQVCMIHKAAFGWLMFYFES